MPGTDGLSVRHGNSAIRDQFVDGSRQAALCLLMGDVQANDEAVVNSM